MTLKTWKTAAWIEDVSLKIWEVATTWNSSRVVHSMIMWDTSGPLLNEEEYELSPRKNKGICQWVGMIR